MCSEQLNNFWNIFYEIYTIWYLKPDSPVNLGVYSKFFWEMIHKRALTVRKHEE